MSPADGAAARRPARVLYLINGFQRGGAERGLLHLVRGGAFEGCELTVASIFAGNAALIADLEAAGARVVAFSPGERMTPASLLRAAAALPALLRRLRPHALILSLPQANLLGRLASVVARPRVVASFEHNTHLAKAAYERGWRLTSGLVDWLLADAPRTAQEVAGRLYPRAPARVVVLPLVSFPPAPPPPPPRDGGPLRLVNAARFTPVKNQQALVRAVAGLRDRGVPAELTLYGEGAGKAACLELAQALGVADRVRAPGFRERWWEDARHDAFVLSSRHEGLCIAVLEAMNAGVPVVAPSIGGLRDYGSADNLEVVADVEPDTLAEAVARLAADPARREALARAGQATAQALYGEAQVARTYARFAADLRALADAPGKGRLR